MSFTWKIELSAYPRRGRPKPRGGPTLKETLGMVGMVCSRIQYIHRGPSCQLALNITNWCTSANLKRTCTFVSVCSIKIFGIWPNAHTRLAMQSRWCGARSGLSQLDLPIICSDEMLSEFVFHYYGFKMCLVFPSYIWSSSVYQDDYTVFSMSPT